MGTHRILGCPDHYAACIGNWEGRKVRAPVPIGDAFLSLREPLQLLLGKGLAVIHQETLTIRCVYFLSGGEYSESFDDLEAGIRFEISGACRAFYLEENRSDSGK